MNNFLLLFVCTGNICRSPMAEGIMKDLILDEFDVKHQVMPIEVLSAGTHAMTGSGASSYAIKVADRHDINLKFHRSRKITEHISKAADLILTMEEAHTTFIKQSWPEITNVYALRRYNRGSSIVEEPIDIVDPIGLDIEVYSSVFEDLQGEIQRVASTIFSLALEKYRAR